MNMVKTVEAKKEDQSGLFGRLFGWGSSKGDVEKSVKGMGSQGKNVDKINDDDRSLRLSKARTLNNAGTEKQGQD